MQGNIIGQARQSASIPEWERVYHEILDIINYFSRISKLGKLNDRDLDLHHELSGGYSEPFSEYIQKAVTFINEKRNPFKKKSYVSLFNRHVTSNFQETS